MQPFTQALEILQNEEKMSIGCLLPTIKLLQENFIEFSKKTTILHCLPLVYGVQSGIEKRFDDMFNNVHLQLASVFDPNFKTIWADKEEKLQLIVLLKSAVRCINSSNSIPIPG